MNPSAKVSLKIIDILGVAVFDLNCLPQEYFVTEANPSTHWVQTAFQSLGLRSLLSASLELEGFQQITIHSEASTAIVVRRRRDYLALLFQGQVALDRAAESQQMLSLIQALNVNKLRQHPHFTVI